MTCDFTSQGLLSAEAASLAAAALDLTRDLHGLDASTLVLQRALFLPLGQIGSGDKWTVRFAEKVRGVRVVNGWTNVLLDAHGALLSVQSTGLPHLSTFATTPSIAAGRARAESRFSLTAI